MSTSHQQRPLKIVLLGAPSAGKGTFASLIANHYNIPTISTGELIRAEIKTASPLAQQMAELTSKGQFVSDEIVISLLEKRLAEPDTANGYILDGFPRTVAQAKALVAKGIDITIALEFILPYEVIVQAVSGRRACAGCQQGYNIANINFKNDVVAINMPPLIPKVENTCDKCGVSPLVLEQRSDDKEDVIIARLKLYDEATSPILQFYKDQNILISHNIKNGKKDWPLVQELLGVTLAKL